MQTKRLVLVSPAKWTDQNDTKFLAAYQARKPAPSLLALCLTSAPETAHHWSSFAHGTDGVRIELDRQAVEEAAARVGVTCKEVDYIELHEVAEAARQTERLPFLKRFPYRDEKEVRLLFETGEMNIETFGLPIPAECIQRVVLGPALPAGLVEPVRRTIKAIRGFHNLPVYPTTVRENAEWINSART